MDLPNDLTALVSQRSEQMEKLLGKVLAGAQPGAVFGQPIVSGSYTIITASEVTSGGGFGSGGGYGQGGPSAASGPSGAEGAPSQGTPQAGGGFGGGGGGGAMGRPVAVIVIGPDGVKVKPVFDVTKIAIAVVTAWAGMALAMRRMRRGRHGRGSDETGV